MQDLSILCHFPDGREGQALHIGPQTADVLSQRFGQHVNSPLHQVTSGGPAAVRVETSSEHGQINTQKSDMLALTSSTMGACEKQLERHEPVMVTVLDNW